MALVYTGALLAASMEEVFAGVEHTGALVMDIEGSVLQVSSAAAAASTTVAVML